MIVSKIAYSVLIFDKDSSTFETIRYCSLIGGNGIKRPFIAFCDIFFMDSDVPLAAALSCALTNGVLKVYNTYLGDLGRNLPSEQEQYYWRGFNKALDAKLSTTKFKRDFMALPASSQSQDFVFKNTYVKTNRQFAEKAGWPLFLELDEQDRYNFEGLRIPINNSIVEMDMLVLSLVKVLLDSLNEKEIVSHLTGTYEKLVGSISKLEVWFQEKQLTGYQDHIKFLRNLQELRSSGTGHRKGKSYQKISKVFDIQKENYTETFSNILESATLFLNYISTHIEELSK
jgi:hypothetical protein